LNVHTQFVADEAVWGKSLRRLVLLSTPEFAGGESRLWPEKVPVSFRTSGFANFPSAPRV
jgi:hypothetical protein